MTFNSYQREKSILNRYLYNRGSGDKKFNTERVFDLELNVDQSKYRTYDYITGRWWQVDPLADLDELVSWMPYNYGYNNPVRYNDPEGDCLPCVIALEKVLNEGMKQASPYSTPAVSFAQSTMKPGEATSGNLLQSNNETKARAQTIVRQERVPKPVKKLTVKYRRN